MTMVIPNRWYISILDEHISSRATNVLKIPREKKFKEMQKAARKDVERAFEFFDYRSQLQMIQRKH